MTHTTSASKRPALALLTFSAILLTASAAHAQRAAEPGIFVDLHGGAQTGTDALSSSTTFSLYGETAGIATRQRPVTGPMFDVRAGYRASRFFGAAVSISGAQSSYTGEVAANIPSPLLVNRPTSISLETETLTRREIGFHLQGLLWIPVSERLELTLAAGPSFIRLQQPIIDATIVGGTQSLALGVRKDTEVVPAVRVGADAMFALTPRLGAGAFVHYTTGKKDFAELGDVRVKSVQAGGGLRIWF